MDKAKFRYYKNLAYIHAKEKYLNSKAKAKAAIFLSMFFLAYRKVLKEIEREEEKY